MERFSFRILPSSAEFVEVYLPLGIQELDMSCATSEMCHSPKILHNAEYLDNLQSVNASGNGYMMKLLGKLNTNLKLLDLSKNHIEELNESVLERLSELQHLYLSRANISNITAKAFINQPYLLSLDISYNNLTEINFMIVSKTLSSLNLEGNKLTRLDIITPLMFPKLDRLAINKNRFNCIDLRNFFRQWIKMEKLELVNNCTTKDVNIYGVDCHSITPYHNSTISPVKASTDGIKKIDFKLPATQPENPKITASNFDNGAVWKVDPSHAFNLTCDFSGFPQPKLNWYKYENDEKKELKFNNSDHKSLLNDGKMLRIGFVLPEDEGKYECEAKYGQNFDNRSVTIQINAYRVYYYVFGTLALVYYYVFGTLALIILFVICLCLCLAVYRRRKRLKNAGLTNFDKGDVNYLNPNLSLDLQADLLPYVREYEFPRDKLRFGKQLGAGAFGIVLEAMAHGIIAHEEETKVAVKMVENFPSNEVMRALVLELKIMAHLGRHLNVVNLLGAVTKDIQNFELMVIVEYCPFGNLKSFLTKNSRYFINQIASNTEEINFKIAPMDIPTNSKYASINCTSMESTLKLENASTSGCMVMIDDSTEAPLRSFTTKDLLIWSFQIARGMDYLASRKVLHGDLAARNILLCDDNVVKICDFGLARSLYKNENYCMKTERCLPLKWLALETINDFVFSMYSDIWSFGIVLWELFSLGATPYPDIKPEELKLKLNDGYRLEKPEFATKNIYDIMLSCWRYNPGKRPKFNDLEKSIGKILRKSDSEHYIDLNEPYMKANECRFNSGEIDYLALQESPNSQAPSVPVNRFQEKYFPYLAKLLNDTFTKTNNLYVSSDSPKLSKTVLNTSNESLALKTFKTNMNR